MSQIGWRMAVVVTVGLVLAARPEEPKVPDTNFDNYKPIAAGVKRAKKVILREGLPHQKWEAELLKEELKTKKTVKLHDFPFYEELLPLKDEDAKKLTELFCANDTFCKYAGAKLCGGFHPDYCIEWQDGKDVYQVLVCLGCHEVRCYGPKIELYCDIENLAFQQFEKILKPYRKNRPEKKG